MQPPKRTSKTPALKPKWKNAPISSPEEYINSVAISANGSLVVAGTFFFPYAAGAKHSPADAAPITVGAFAWNAKGKLLWQDKFQATEGVYWVGLSRDGSWAASGGLSAPAHGFLNVYDASSGARALTYAPPVRVNMVAFSGDGSYFVAGADNVYLFSRTGTNWAGPQQFTAASGDSIIAVAISADGQWIVAGTFLGAVILLRNVSGAFTAHATWKLAGGSVHWVAMSADGSTFAVAASGSNAYCFATSSFMTTPQPAWSAPLVGCSGCRAVALSDDGSLLSAVGNAAKAGKAFLFSNQGGSGNQLWVQPTHCNPNSTSIDSAGKYVTVADGYPDQTPGDFYLFAASGTPEGVFQTGNMSWPLQISADGSAMAGGSDDSFVYFFALP